MAQIGATLFLSDLHLPPDDSPLRARFRAFLRGPARAAAAVYILGDLFEAWIGDDVGLQLYATEVAELAALTALGVPVYFQHGNRDFLVGRDFFELTGVRALPDPARVVVDGGETLLSHGDRYCTDDRAYQRWRRFSRQAWAQWLFLRLPRARRLRIAQGLRAGSTAAKRSKAAAIMDVNPAAVRAELQRYGLLRLIHGHTHRPATHSLDLPAGQAQRIVLPDWNAQHCDYLSLGAGGAQRCASPAG